MKQERKYVLVKKKPTIMPVILDYSCQELEQSFMGPIKFFFFFSWTPATQSWMGHLFQS